jgi:membrane-associated phospholipid phosphatase
VSGIDESVYQWFVAHREPWLTAVMQAVTTLGGSAFLIPLVAALGAWYRWRHDSWRPLALLGTSYVGALLLSNVLKALFGRPRPPVASAIGEFLSPAMPSGHATHAAAVWLMVGLVVVGGTGIGRRRRLVGWLAVGAIVLLVGISRLYLAAHWLTDVLAGWIIGTVWALAVARQLRGSSLRQARKEVNS